MKTLFWNPQYFKDMGYLGYSFQKDGETWSSGMGWTSDHFKKIEAIIGADKFALLSKSEKIEISDEEMKAIQSLWHDLKYKKFHKAYVPREANMNHVKVIYEAFETRSAVMLEYEEGYEMYPSEEDEGGGASVSENGLVHVAYIGISNGTKPILLHLAGRSSCGGTEFMYSGLKSVKLIGGCAR